MYSKSFFYKTDVNLHCDFFIQRGALRFPLHFHLGQTAWSRCEPGIYLEEGSCANH
jgi:hypothetical protein